MANVLKTIATTIVSASNMVTTLATRSTAILDHSLGSLENMSSNMHDHTCITRLGDMTRRRKEFLRENSDLGDDIPEALRELLNMKLE